MALSAGVTAPDLAWRVERAGRAAWPASRKLWLGDWQLHLSEGFTRRGNSANPLRPDCRLAAGLVAACEALYARHRQPAIFRLPSLLEPQPDRLLAAAGYASEGESLVLFGTIAGIAVAADPAVRLFSRPSGTWFAAMAALQGHDSRQRRVYRRIVRGLVAPARFALLEVDGEPAALAYGVLLDGLLCYESVIADRRRRRSGFARRVVASLAARAREEGVEGACLEVEAANAPARALYDALGLDTELYRYHYRRAPSERH